VIALYNPAFKTPRPHHLGRRFDLFRRSVAGSPSSLCAGKRNPKRKSSVHLWPKPIRRCPYSVARLSLLAPRQRGFIPRTGHRPWFLYASLRNWGELRDSEPLFQLIAGVPRHDPRHDRATYSCRAISLRECLSVRVAAIFARRRAAESSWNNKNLASLLESGCFSLLANGAVEYQAYLAPHVTPSAVRSCARIG